MGTGFIGFDTTLEKGKRTMLQTLNKHRFLLEELVKRDLDRKYKGALLGAAWSVMNPLHKIG